MDWLQYMILTTGAQVQKIVREQFSVEPSNDQVGLYNQCMALIDQYGPDATVPELLKAHPDKEAFEGKCKCKKKNSYRKSDATKCETSLKRLEELKSQLEQGRYSPDALTEAQKEIDNLLEEVKQDNCFKLKKQSTLLETFHKYDKQYNIKGMAIAAAVTYFVIKVL